VCVCDMLIFLQTGTSEYDATTLQRRIGARTGGISFQIILDQPVGKGGAVGAPDAVIHKLMVRAYIYIYIYTCIDR